MILLCISCVFTPICASLNLSGCIEKMRTVFFYATGWLLHRYVARWTFKFRCVFDICGKTTQQSKSWNHNKRTIFQSKLFYFSWLPSIKTTMSKTERVGVNITRIDSPSKFWLKLETDNYSCGRAHSKRGEQKACERNGGLAWIKGNGLNSFNIFIQSQSR